MLRLVPAQYPMAYALYLEHDKYFPLVAAVLRNAQDGVVYADNEKIPTQVYVEHVFGFAQVFGSSVPAFDRALHDYLLVDKAFSCAKVRLYTPDCPEFLQVSEYDGLRSWRQRFQLDGARGATVDDVKRAVENGLVLVQADASHVKLIEDAFGVVGRFWRTENDFANHSNAVVAFVNGNAASICYAAAVADCAAEVDVLTLPAYRHRGLAKVLVQLFSQRCRAQNILPLWDCFTNNTASMALCQSTGFVALAEPYAFFTISK